MNRLIPLITATLFAMSCTDTDGQQSDHTVSIPDKVEINGVVQTVGSSFHCDPGVPCAMPDEQRILWAYKLHPDGTLTLADFDGEDKTFHRGSIIHDYGSDPQWVDSPYGEFIYMPAGNAINLVHYPLTEDKIQSIIDEDVPEGWMSVVPVIVGPEVSEEAAFSVRLMVDGEEAVSIEEVPPNTPIRCDIKPQDDGAWPEVTLNIARYDGSGRIWHCVLNEPTERTTVMPLNVNVAGYPLKRSGRYALCNQGIGTWLSETGNVLEWRSFSGDIPSYATNNTVSCSWDGTHHYDTGGQQMPPW